MSSLRTVSASNSTRNPNEHRYDYKHLGVQAVERPRAYQPRVDGPPLLFATDIRMTILVALALADGPLRQANLWKHIGKSAKTALYPLVKHGLVAMWSLNRGRKYVALDPCHPAAVPLRQLLLAVADHYPGFSKPKFSVDNRDAGDAPTRPSRRRDVRLTFGDPRRTMPLLLVHIREQMVGVDVPRIVPYVNQSTARDVFWMYRAFGILKMEYVVAKKRRGYAFTFDDACPLVPYIRAVLTALDKAMPQWRIRAERQASEPIPKRQDDHRSRRKPGRWKW
jgi:hypothetical protein